MGNHGSCPKCGNEMQFSDELNAPYCENCGIEEAGQNTPAPAGTGQAAKHKPCPNCGNELEFSASHGGLYCKHCGTEQAVLRDPDFRPSGSDYLDTIARMKDDSESTESITLDCDNCAAHIELADNIVADRCPYCESPVVAISQSRRMIRPSAILPFRVNCDEATEHYKKWLKSRWFMPGKVKHEARIRKFKGMYLPHWTYDNDTTTSYTGMRGIHYWVTVSYTATENGKSVRKTRQERRTRWYPAAGTVHNRFKNLLVAANHSLPPDLVDKLTPWGLEGLQEYQADFIRGHQEQSYSLRLASGFDRAKGMMDPEIRHTIRRDIGGDEQRILSTSIHYKNISYKLILLPVWENHFEFQNKTYTFLVNARTGEVQGKRPWSAIKITFFVLFLLVVVGIIVALIAQYNG